MGRLTTPHGPIDTPAFMPVGTQASVKGLTPEMVAATGAQVVLANTYHLMVRPGAEVIAELGGLHKVMAWGGAILTDSGGFQVFSLGRIRRVRDDGVVFANHVDGAELLLTPELAIRAQNLLGADIIMAFDECVSADADRSAVSAAARRTGRWARQCRQAHDASGRADEQELFGIVQGGLHADLRRESADELMEIGFGGYAIGGLSVGEGHDRMIEVLAPTAVRLPAARPRYLMGVGEPKDLLAAVGCGVDMFDCVLPTRNGRNGLAFTADGPLRLRNERFRLDGGPLESGCDCYTCGRFSRGTLRHLFQANEMLGPTLVSVHNVRFFQRLMGRAREEIGAGRYEMWSGRWLSRYESGEDNE